MNDRSIPHHSRLSSLLENTVADFASCDLHRSLLSFNRDLEDLLYGRFSMHSRLGDFGEKVGNGLTDRLDETIDNRRGVDRNSVGSTSGGGEDRTRSFDVKSNNSR